MKKAEIPSEINMSRSQAFTLPAREAGAADGVSWMVGSDIVPVIIDASFADSFIPPSKSDALGDRRMLES